MCNQNSCSCFLGSIIYHAAYDYLSSHDDTFSLSKKIEWKKGGERIRKHRKARVVSIVHQTPIAGETTTALRAGWPLLMMSADVWPAPPL